MSKVSKGDPKRGIKASSYRQYASIECYHQNRVPVAQCPRGHPYRRTLGGRNKCELCGAARRLAGKTHRDFLEVLTELEGKPKKCPVCKRKDKGDWWHRLVPDHDHQTGLFRGWLCGSCNKALGLMGDNPKNLRKLANYLER